MSKSNGDYYNEILGVKCNPLSDAPLKGSDDMDMFVKTPKYEELEGFLNQISHDLQVRVGIMGDPGSGKTTILNYADYYAVNMKVLAISIDGKNVHDFDYLLNWLIREILDRTDEITMDNEDQEKIKQFEEEISRQWGQITYQDQVEDHTKIGVNKILDAAKEKTKKTGISQIKTPETPYRFLLLNQVGQLIDILVPKYRCSILVLVDEAHDFFKEEFSDYVNFFYIKRIAFIFSGYSEMIEKCTASFMRKKDFFTKIIELDTMLQDELEELIEKRFAHYKIREDYKNPFSSGAIKLVGEICDFNPYEFIHLSIRILEYAEKKRKTKITKSFVKKWLKDDALRKMGGRSDDEDQILRAIANSGGNISQDELISYLENLPLINMTNIKAKVEAAKVGLQKKGCLWIYQEGNKIRFKICASLRYCLPEVSQ